MKNMYYHKINVISALTHNYWVLVALAFIAIAIIIGTCQYRIRGHRLVKRFGDGPYLLIGITSAITISVMLFVESHAGIIQLLDNLLVGNESPILSLTFVPLAVAVFGVIFGVITAVIGDITSGIRKRSLIKKLRLAAMVRRKAHRPQQIRRGQPTGNPRPGTPRPTRYNAERDAANHRHHANRVNDRKGMHRR